MSKENQPVHRIRLSHVSAAIFRNETSEGKTFYNTQFDRSYRDGEDWKHTSSFGRDDLLLVAKVADLAHSWVYEQLKSDTSDEANAPEPH